MKVLTGLLTGIIIMLGSISITNAATKCVALNSSSTCTGTPVAGKVDWTATCNNIPITGVGVCSSTTGTVGQTEDTITTVSSADANKYCWCKMTSPVLSRFVYARIGGTAALCSRSCASDCVNFLVGNAPFRAGLFSDLQ